MADLFSTDSRKCHLWYYTIKTMEMGRPIVGILRMQNSDLTISNNMLWPGMAQIARQHLFAHRTWRTFHHQKLHCCSMFYVLCIRPVTSGGSAHVSNPQYSPLLTIGVGLVMDPPLIPMCLIGQCYRKLAKFAKSIHIANAKKAVGAIARASIKLYAAQRYERQ